MHGAGRSRTSRTRTHGTPFREALFMRSAIRLSQSLRASRIVSSTSSAALFPGTGCSAQLAASMTASAGSGDADRGSRGGPPSQNCLSRAMS